MVGLHAYNEVLAATPATSAAHDEIVYDGANTKGGKDSKSSKEGQMAVQKQPSGWLNKCAALVTSVLAEDWNGAKALAAEYSQHDKVSNAIDAQVRASNRSRDGPKLWKCSKTGRYAPYW